MNNLVQQSTTSSNNGQQVTMTSLELVDFINSQRGEGESELRHDHFMAKVPKVLGENQAPKFLGTSHYINGAGNKVPRQIYIFPKREACLMAMSYSYELQAKVFDRMTELEASSSYKIPQSLSQALMLAAQQAEQIEQQQAALAIAAPKAAFVDSYVESTGLKSFRQVAKLLCIKEPCFRECLVENKIMYRLNGEWVAYKNHEEAGRFKTKTGVSEHNDHAYNTAYFTPKGVEWIAGLLAVDSLRKAA